MKTVKKLIKNEHAFTLIEMIFSVKTIKWGKIKGLGSQNHQKTP